MAEQSRRKFPPAVPATRTSDAEVQGRKDPYRNLRPPTYQSTTTSTTTITSTAASLQTEPFCRPGRVASAGGLNASDQHPSQARSGLSDNAKPDDVPALCFYLYPHDFSLVHPRNTAAISLVEARA